VPAGLRATLGVEKRPMRLVDADGLRKEMTRIVRGFSLREIAA
jgi:hypothetical protein